MQAIDGESTVFSHLPHRDLLDADLSYSRETSWILPSTSVLETLFQELDGYHKGIRCSGCSFKEIQKKLPDICSFHHNLKELE